MLMRFEKRPLLSESGRFSIENRMNIFHDIQIMDDNRKFERFDITAPARIEILKPGDKGEKILLETHNLSAGGIFIKNAKPLPEGSPVKMEIFLPASVPETQTPPDRGAVIVVTGRIIRSTDEGTAICFNDDYDITPLKI
jgi:hypothetical protein